MIRVKHTQRAKRAITIRVGLVNAVRELILQTSFLTPYHSSSIILCHALAAKKRRQREEFLFSLADAFVLQSQPIVFRIK